MPNSKVSICNLALAALGEDSIRSFDEDNKRARMCDVFFDQTKEWLLTKFDWPFARKRAKLQSVVIPDEEIPSGMYAYQLPADCRRPRDIAPPGSRDKWEVMGKTLFCQKSSDVYLYYTMNVTDVSRFSDTFVTILYLAMAVRMAPALTQDKNLTRALNDQLNFEMREAWEADANVGNSYRSYDENPENDTFVNPDVTAATNDWWENQ